MKELKLITTKEAKTLYAVVRVSFWMEQQENGNWKIDIFVGKGGEDLRTLATKCGKQKRFFKSADAAINACKEIANEEFKINVEFSGCYGE